ncbi:hypothetical protein NP493_1167g00014 [Ridgeia piscesae]|uniref:U5 small nuclear ribonucleoprotein TSSC4 n=1 Tax=Ridgeia piscesae TaxID=27915 RepID=A0AAD9NIR0_RIDPI|nr:hypothetical protein NP493_1167g00014 [Ridgeia piscesae]
MSEDPSPFRLSGTDTGFSSRSKDVFSTLETIEAKHDAFQKASAKSTSRTRDAGALIKDDPVVDDPLPRKRPNAFKRPRGCPPPRRRGTPDYRQHPERWTKYDLSDVQADQMSERSNTAAALDFLNTQRKRREESDDVDDADHGTIQFKKPTTKAPCQTAGLGKRNAETTDTAFGNSKLVMPEYIVGQSASKKRHTKQTTGQVKCDAVGLGHLTHSDDEAEEDENVSEEATVQMQENIDASTSSSTHSAMEQCQSTETHSERTVLESDDKGALSTEDVPLTDSVTTETKQVAFKKSTTKSRAHQRRVRRGDDTEENDD